MFGHVFERHQLRARYGALQRGDPSRHTQVGPAAQTFARQGRRRASVRRAGSRSGATWVAVSPPRRPTRSGTTRRASRCSSQMPRSGRACRARGIARRATAATPNSEGRAASLGVPLPWVHRVALQFRCGRRVWRSTQKLGTCIDAPQVCAEDPHSSARFSKSMGLSLRCKTRRTQHEPVKHA